MKLSNKIRLFLVLSNLLPILTRWFGKNTYAFHVTSRKRWETIKTEGLKMEHAVRDDGVTARMCSACGHDKEEFKGIYFTQMWYEGLLLGYDPAFAPCIDWQPVVLVVKVPTKTMFVNPEATNRSGFFLADLIRLQRVTDLCVKEDIPVENIKAAFCLITGKQILNVITAPWKMAGVVFDKITKRYDRVDPVLAAALEKDFTKTN